MRAEAEQPVGEMEQPGKAQACSKRGKAVRQKPGLRQKSEVLIKEVKQIKEELSWQ